MRRNSVVQGTINEIPYRVCPAKTYLTKSNGSVRVGRDVFTHCQIVGQVAQALLGKMPAALRERLFPEGSHLAAACHDIGKVSPTFYEKIRQACSESSLTPLNDIDPALENQWGGHAGVSQVSVGKMGASAEVGAVLGQHHGFSPELGGYQAGDEVFGGASWQAERVALVAALKEALQGDWPRIDNPAQARVLAGLTSVSDWVGSGPLFEDPQRDWKPLITQALDEAGFVPPQLRRGLEFEDIFGFSPRPLQSTLVNSISGPGVYVLEAPMGLGKTEAALFAAYRLMDAGHASGIYFALPTQLTSNKIHDRFGAFLAHILNAECRHRQALLLHGQAWLLQAEMGEEGRPGGAWFHHAKRGLLAPFAVGTIDQALMAVMNIKHGFVRAFGLAGKVVILDEVHSYDAYTGTILDELVNFLRQLDCTVIILSATLCRARREALLQGDSPGLTYPQLAVQPAGGTLTEYPISPPPASKIALRLPQQDNDAIQEALCRAAQGQQILWVENTVAEAQDRYRTLAAFSADAGIACGLLHSRFTVAHRQANEDRWVGLYGKTGWPERGLQGRILVGTQVLEQSLDIDADFLVSRFAPSDMLLQRLGRLWRHEGTPRPKHARAEAWLLAPELELAIDQPVTAFGDSAAIYSPYVLCRSLQVWQGLTGICLPGSIRSLIEDTYVSRDESGAMGIWLYELEHGSQRGQYKRPGRKDLQRLASGTLSRVGTTRPESQAQTRYCEQDTLDTLLLRSLEHRPDQQNSVLTLLDGSRVILPSKRHQLDPAGWRQLSICLMRQIVSLRPPQAPPASDRGSLERLGLHHVFHLGNPQYEDALLRVALVDDCDTLRSLDGAAITGRKTLHYRDDMGYQVIKFKD